MQKHASDKRLWLEVDLGKLVENYKTIEKKVAPASVMGVLKARAYGMGVQPVAEALMKAGCDRFGAATVREALEIKAISGKPVQILGALLDEELELAIQEGIEIHSASEAMVNRGLYFAEKAKKPLLLHWFIDSGMGRLGIPYAQAKEFILKNLNCPWLKTCGLATHFPSANHPDWPITQEQIQKMQTLERSFPPDTFPLKHYANSDGINNFPESHENLVRAGINLYGVFDPEGMRSYQLKPVVSLKSRILAIRKLPKGHGIGYSSLYTLKKDSLVATVPAGYADGIPMHIANKSDFLCQGHRLPVIGRVSMDYSCVLLPDESTIAVGDEVTLLGEEKGQQNTAEDWAKMKGTHPYDILCSLGPRVVRNYID